ncbi:MAG: flagellar assembly protein FliW [Gallionellaceae bacterium]|jgi:flagellar assembly factor FliW|nr:flagellar assembly protein FliW [Gallionellaceae bacterium]
MANIKVDTRFGELSVDPSQLITFPRGIPGFEKSTMWKLFHEIDEQGNWVSGVVMHLQSIADGQVSLPLTDPTLFGFNYNLVLTDNEVAELKLEDPNDVLVLMVLYPKDAAQKNVSNAAISNVCANISAPILINTKSRIGIQKILAGNEFKTSFCPPASN